MSNQTFYVASLNPDDKIGGIYQYDIDLSTLNHTQTHFYPLANCIYLHFPPDHKTLYASTQGPGQGNIHAYKIDAVDKSLKLINSQKSGANCPCHLNCNPEGTYIYCANYGEDGDSALVEFPINTNDGSLQPASKVIRHDNGKGNKGPNIERQECSHIHCSYVTSHVTTYVCAVDLGIDKVKIYPIDPKNGICENSPIADIDLQPGFGPRHIIFDKKVAYVANELGNTVCSYIFNEDKKSFTHIQTLSTICPPKYTNQDQNQIPFISYVAAIRISNDNKTLFVSNRGANSTPSSIACIEINKGDAGEMKVMNIVDVKGKFPRDFDVFPNGEIVAATNEHTDNITFFKYSPEDVNLVPVEKQIDVHHPLCIVF